MQGVLDVTKWLWARFCKFSRIYLICTALISTANALDSSPAAVNVDNNNNTFAALSVGYMQKRITNSALDYKDTRAAVNFGLKRGIAFTESKQWLVNGYLEGSAGSENQNGLYTINVGAQVGYKMWRAILHLGIGYELSNLATDTQASAFSDNSQYNIHGLNARAELFFDIAKGYGLSIGYMRGFNERGKNLGSLRFQSQSIIIGISYYDFSI